MTPKSDKPTFSLQIFSEDSFHYDHRVLERGVCVQNCYVRVDKAAAGNNQLSQLRACINQRLQENSDLQIDPNVQIYHCYNKANDSPPYGNFSVIISSRKRLNINFNALLAQLDDFYV